MAVASLHAKLAHEGYLCTKPFTAKVAAALNTKPVAGAVLFGKAGTGKTYLPETLVRIFGAELYFKQCTPGMREEELMVQLEPSELTVSGMRTVEGVLVEAARATNEGRKVYLVLDEWDKTRPSADAFLLDFLQTGRLRSGSMRITASLENLTVFLTMNDERDISEPLLRRLPRIPFEPLPVDQVCLALERSHPDNPYIEAACTLYLRTLQAQLDKPATVQELRQLIDAIELLGDDADWDTLVQQYVTKGEAAHQLLKSVESEPVKLPKKSAKGRLSEAAYQLGELASALAEPLPTALPALTVRHKIAPLPLPAEHDQVSGIIAYSLVAYNALASYVHTVLGEKPLSDPARIGTFAEVVGDGSGSAIVIRSDLKLERYQEYAAFASVAGIGTLVLVEESVTEDEFLSFHRQAAGRQQPTLQLDAFSSERLSGIWGRSTQVAWCKGQGLRVEVALPAWGEGEAFAKAWNAKIKFPATRKEEARRAKAAAAEARRERERRAKQGRNGSTPSSSQKDDESTGGWAGYDKDMASHWRLQQRIMAISNDPSLDEEEKQRSINTLMRFLALKQQYG